ncbi:hypothetical protein GIY56_08205 [Paracoccus sp. YIM 132242]|uniref:Hemerythrin-like domain-containing protein n=1 Tax=Paracoccus lichenicola TaxID=2665644 RepID=A0A6L6HM58_9RHOB|nr:hemerythrin domain-containing protein [Paracoccus lichenicola]MTE00267.1 hypothetical protein [Paracoccus lichenicola]
MSMTLRQTIQAAPGKAVALITKRSATSNQAVKARESLHAELNDELVRYAEIEEHHLLPLLRKNPETRDLAVGALKGNRELRASLEKLAGLPKDDDAFLVALSDLNKGLQQHLRNERKELLPAVLKVLGDAEMPSVAAAPGDAVKAVEASGPDEGREERREQAGQAERQAAEARQAVARVQREAERVTREATEKVADVTEHGGAAVRDRTRQVTETFTERAQQVATDTRAAMTTCGDSARKMAKDMQVAATTSGASLGVLSDVSSAWTTWFEKATRANADAAQKLSRAKSVKDLAAVQREFATSIMHNWMERRAAMLQAARRHSKQASNPLQARVNETA